MLVPPTSMPSLYMALPSPAALFQRNIVGVHAEVPGPHQGQTGLGPPQRIAGQPTTSTRLPYLRASVVTGVKVSTSTRQIRSGVRGHDLPFYGGGEILVLELHKGAAALVLGDASRTTLPKLKAPRVSRSTSAILPLKSL